MPRDTDQDAANWTEDLHAAAISRQHFPHPKQSQIVRRSLVHCGNSSQRPDLVVAIPVCNEIDRIPTCVQALEETLAELPGAGVVLMVNNSTDGSAEAALTALMTRRMNGIVVDVTLATDIANAGWSRRLALDIAVRWARPDAVLMTTDADGRVAPDWADANLAALVDGAHLVCGRIAPDAAEAAQLPSGIGQSDAIERMYTALSIELDARLDPRAHDPWPHHGLASGASLAIRARDYCAVGRLPKVACSEDRAFAALVERHDLCVRHSDAPLVTVSCRLQGRARGGMADAIAARIANPDSLADQRLYPARVTAQRATYRNALRAAWTEKTDTSFLVRQLIASPAQISRARSCSTFGAFWAEIEAGAASLAATRMRPSQLARELPELRRLVTLARAET